MKTSQNIEQAANLKGMAKHTYNRVISAMAEDTTAAMLHAFSALTDGAKAIVLQSGKYSNLYIRGEFKGMAVEEAANELTELAADGVSRKLRKIDLICAVAFLAEYISRQRKAVETPETPSPENTPNISDLARWIDIQLSTIIDGVSAGYTLGNYNSVWIDKGATVFNISLANGETVEIDSDNYNTAEEIANAIIAVLSPDNTTPVTIAGRKMVEPIELTHAGQCLYSYLRKDSFIYVSYTQKAIEAIVNDGQTINSDDVRRCVRNAIDHASWQVEKYDHLTPTAQDVEQVTRNYVAYIVNCTKY